MHYALHPFFNWNKRTTRVLETMYIQSYIDNNHYLKGMAYWFRKNQQEYIGIIKDVLTSKKSIKEWVIYYMNEFEQMSKYSLLESKYILDSDIKKYISPDRQRYYDDKDLVYYRFIYIYWENNFSITELKQYLMKAPGKNQKYGKSYSVCHKFYWLQINFELRI